VANAGDKAGDAFRTVELQLAAVKRQIGMQLTPTFLKFADDFSNFLAKNPAAVKEWGGILSVVVKDIVGSFAEIADWVKQITEALDWLSGRTPKTDGATDAYGPGGSMRSSGSPYQGFDPKTRSFKRESSGRLDLDFSPDKAKQVEETDEDRAQQKLTELIGKVQQTREEYRR
jgi:hypothetical protein